MKAHQRIVRERLVELDPIPKRGDGTPIDVDIKKAVIKPVTRAEAQEIILKYEWLGKLAAVNWYYFGIFFEGHLAGVVVYGQEYAENMGVWDKFGYTGRIILLNRGACVHWAHPHSASKLIRESMKMLPDKYKVITCTVDDLAGEIGTIYQACNFDYVGVMRKGKKREAFLIDGKIVSARSMRSRFGTQRLDILRQHIPDIIKIEQNAKGRYFAFRGNKKEKKELRTAIDHLVKPYPKRTDTTTEPPSLFNYAKDK